MDLKALHLHWRNSSYKGKTYRSYCLAKAFRKNGKNRKEIVLKLGKLSDSEADRWRQLLHAIKKPDTILTTLDNIVVTDHFAFLDVAVANEIWNFWKLDNAFDNNDKTKLTVAQIARILTLNRCIEPVSKSQTPEWFAGTALPWMLDIKPEHVNPSRIFRELDAIEDQKEEICQHLFERLSRDYPDSMKSVFYDLSSTTFTGTKCVLVNWGHCKEGFQNHAVLAIVVNQDGIPFYWEVLPGNTADSTTISWLIERLTKRFKVQQTTLVFDRGMVSDDNLTYIESYNIKYITAMDKNQIRSIANIDFNEYTKLNLDNVEDYFRNSKEYFKYNEMCYYRETKNDGDRRYILCFNLQLFKDQRKARNEAIADFYSFVENLNAELLSARNSRKREATYNKFKKELSRAKLSGFVDVILEIIEVTVEYIDNSEKIVQTYQAKMVIDQEQQKQAENLDGFWLLVTNHTEKEGDEFIMRAPDAIMPYREKVLIEAAFRDIKSFIDISPVYVWTEKHVKAHYTICVLAYLINRTISLRLKKEAGNITKDIVTHVNLYKYLDNCMIDRILVDNYGLSTYNMTLLSDEHKELLKRVGLEDLTSSKIAEKARLS